jgi:hypothetical protein
MARIPADTELAGQPDSRLAGAVDVARMAAEQEGGSDAVGAHVEVADENGGAVTHLFEANYPGYRGWRWAVTVASPGPDGPVTISEVVLLPGPQALVAPDWVPWERRVRAGDLGVGDLLPTALDDPRLVPGYLGSDDPAIEDIAAELGLGRRRVLSREGRQDAAERWHVGEYGPGSPMAVTAPGVCGTCGFYLPIAGSLSAAFGVCGNEFAPADGHVVHVEFGCGAHSEVEVEPSPVAAVAELVYDDALLDVEPMSRREHVDGSDPNASNLDTSAGGSAAGVERPAASAGGSDVSAGGPEHGVGESDESAGELDRTENERDQTGDEPER